MKNTKQVANIPDRLREAMDDAGKTAADLAEETGLHHSSISRYKSGKMEPKVKAIGLLSRALGVSEMWLCGYDVPKGRTEEQQKNDHLIKMVAKLRTDADFFDVVSMLAQLPAAEYASIKNLISAIIKK